MNNYTLMIAEVAELVWFDFVLLGFVVVHIALAGAVSRELVLVYSPQAAALRQNIRRIAPRISSLFGG